jgi:hypothetical protein
VVTLDGSASYDPEGGQLSYKWTQTGGPSVVLSSATVAKPTFTAPGGPASLTFSLTVSNGARTSTASTVAVEVAAPAGTSNVAPSATATASSEAPEQGAALAIDGVISGYPTNPFAEWSSNGEKAGAWLQLSWSRGYELDHVVLYDRPNPDDQITSGHLTFSDGSTVAFGALPNAGSTGLTVSFAARTTTSLRVTVDGVSSSTFNIGLSEVEAWGSAAPAGQTATKPAFTNARTASFTTGAAGTFTAVTTGVPTATLKSSGALPSGLAFKAGSDGTATISGVPAASAASAGSSKSYALTLTATNSAGSATQTLTITVTNNEPKPTRPVFTTPATRSATLKKPVEIPVEATGAPTPTLSLSGSAPKGLSFKATAAGKAVLSGTPTATGTYRLSIVAANSAGTTTQALSLTVSR